MADVVKRRDYDSSSRQARSRQSRGRVVDAARTLFLERGYPGASMEAISAAADIAPATLYRFFTSKREVLKAVIDTTAVGDDEPIALHDRSDVLALRDERDPGRYLDGFARVARVVGDRLAPVHEMLHSAAVVDQDAADMVALIREQRYTGQGVVARGLVERDALRHTLTEAEAHDIIYALMSPDLRRVLTQERGWDADRYQEWLASTMRETLLERRQHRSKSR